MGYVGLLTRLLIAGVFIVSGIAKVTDLKAFAQSMRRLYPLSRLTGRMRRGLAGAVVGAELLIAALAALPMTAATGLAMAAPLLCCFAALAASSARQPAQAPCRCFGVSRTPLGLPHAVRNLVLAAVAVAGAAASTGRNGPLQPAAIAMTVVIAAVGVALTVFFDDLLVLFTDPEPAKGADFDAHRGRTDTDDRAHPARSGPDAGDHPPATSAHRPPWRT